VIVKDKAYKMRAMTIMGFCLYADICHVTWANYKNNEDFVTVITRIENVIKSQKFEGAAADLLNANIIARDLGLTDKSDITTKGDKINPVNLSNLTYEQLKDLAREDTTGG
jgi:hypothetical protein